ncbi:MAG TPA: alpha/beta hydrolase [Cyclobacteriaceae bacterium]|nr:alpha/beta hydrolase [Cyclobacteriaceae bacterium]
MHSLFVHDQGTGPPLVLIHGFCETSEIWDSFIKSLTNHHRVIRPDLPGFGNSAPLSGRITIDQVAEALAGWLKQSGIHQAMVLGHSLGGYVTLALAEQHSHLLRGFGLFHSTCFADTEEKKANRNRIIEFVKRNGVRPFVETFVPGLFHDKYHPAINSVRDIASGTRAETLIQYAEAMRDRPDRSGVLEISTAPKLIIAGREDAAVPVLDSRKMAKLGQKTTYSELERVAHMGFLEAPAECRLITTSFTDRLFESN